MNSILFMNSYEHLLTQKYDEYANKGNIHHGKIEINI